MSASQLTLSHLQKQKQVPSSLAKTINTASLDFSSFSEVPGNSPSLLLKLKNNNYFYGPIVDRKAEGDCIYVFGDGAYFKGQCRAGKFQGKGALLKYGDDFEEKLFWYQGEWKNSKPHGKGREQILNSMVYEGTFSQGKKHGQGTMTYIDGTKYQGEFVSNQVQGKGTYTTQVHEWTGNWQQGYLEGNGKQVSKGISSEELEDNGISVYQGGFERGLKHGKGTYKWGRNFSEYSGTFSRGQLDGEGNFKLGEAEYHGVWKKGVEVSLQSTIQFKRVRHQRKT